MNPTPIVFFNRHTGQMETEAVYGEGFLRWAYENPLGRLTTAALVRRAAFSRWYGWRMSQPASKAKIPAFIEQYKIDVAEMADAPDSFPDFNAFFCRKLKPSARPIAPGEDVLVFPADGRHFAIPDISANDGIFVKGIRFDLAALLRDDALAAKFARGSLVISRLCPVDYHRFHFPCSGHTSVPRFIPGDLYSVSPIALGQRPTLLWENKRCLTRVNDDRAGEVLLLEIGATCVGTIIHTHPSGTPAVKGDEKGYFLFGGSCFITIFEPGRVKLDEDLVRHSAERHEVYARMGEHMAEIQ